MPVVNQDLVDKFKTQAKIANATVHEFADLDAALAFLPEICAKKNPCEILSDEPDTPKGPLGPNGVPTRLTKIIAAPCLDAEHFAKLEAMCKEKGFLCLHEGLRKYLAGIDVGFEQAELGVAASGTCLMNTDSEESRLAGMISEVSVIALKKSEIYADLPSIVSKLRARMGSGNPAYTTFVTGPSRTADIERVSAIGVHGPLELHILLLEN